MAGPAPSIPLGRIAGYEVQGKLGAGGMGVVYKALDLKLNRTVALKFLSEEEVAAEDRERLLREARAASALDHPNIAAVHTVEENAEGRTFIVMGYYEGETLANKIRHSPLQPARAANIAMQIAGGLQHAHARNITHRDVKPANVLITNDGTAKILDFGLARIHGPSASTESASLSGTLLYMSPEQVQGRPLDARTDIWALGVVLYQMLTGRLPFFTDNAASTILAILNAPPAPMPGVPGELQLIILRALSKTPESRYQNCAELIRDLEKLAIDDRLPTVTIDRSELQRQLRSASQSASGLPITSPRRILWLTVALCIAIGISLAVAIAFTPLRWRIFGPQEKHIAVLPFETNSKDPAVQSLADGLMESIAGKLSNLSAGGKSLWVVPAMQIRRRKIEDPEAARRELGATLAIQGSVAQASGNIRLKLDLIDTKSQRLLGSVEVHGDENTLAALEDKVVSRLAGMMDLGGAGSETKGGEVSGAAYEYYLKGRGLLQRFDVSDNVNAAIVQFEAAVKADPKFALAYNALAEAHWNKYRLDQNPQWLEKANDYGKQAIQLNDQLPAVYITLGNIHDASGKQDLALEEFQHALKLDPANADALIGISRVYEHKGRDKEAEEAVRQGATLRPDYWGGYYELAAYYFRHRRFEDAAREFKHVIELAPDSAAAHANYATALKNINRTDEAAAEFEKSIKLKPTYAALNNLGVLYYAKRRWAEAANMFEQSMKLNPADYRVWENMGLASDWLGQHDKAMESYRHSRELLEKQILLKSDDPEMQSSLGLLYARGNMRDKTLPRLDAALARAPKNPNVLSKVAEAYMILGERPRALAVLKQAMAAGMTGDELDRSQILRELQPALSGQSPADVAKR
jgi:serine/threonine-protein kinase